VKKGKPGPQLIIFFACPWCEKRLTKRKRRDSGEFFLGCMGYPKCKFTGPYFSETNHLVRENQRLWGEIEKLDNLVNQGQETAKGSTDSGNQEIHDELAERRRKKQREEDKKLDS